MCLKKCISNTHHLVQLYGSTIPRLLLIHRKIRGKLQPREPYERYAPVRQRQREYLGPRALQQSHLII